MDQLPHYLKEGTIGFSSDTKPGSDVVVDFMEKFCLPEQHADIKKAVNRVSKKKNKYCFLTLKVWHALFKVCSLSHILREALRVLRTPSSFTVNLEKSEFSV